MSEMKTNEVILGNKKYLHVEDEDKDYLIDQSNNKVKINFSFSKNPKQNEEANKAIKAFFTELYA